jgi:hypothetical protein
MSLSIREADETDLSEVLAILAECSAWLKTKGIIQWPDRFPEAPILRTIQRGEVFVATESETPVATVTLQWRDRRSGGIAMTPLSSTVWQSVGHMPVRGRFSSTGPRSK